jgi:hypothetical protein
MFAVRTAAEACSQIQLGAPARGLLRDGMAPRAFLDALLAAGHLPDALRFLAAALPKREAVWWACVCTRLVLDQTTPQPAVAALVAAETWCYRPTEENRRAAHAAAEAATLEHPAALAAMGAFFSGGSIAPPHITTPVQPGPFHTARMVAGAVMLADVMREPERAPERQRTFLAKGAEIAMSAAAQDPRRGGA